MPTPDQTDSQSEQDSPPLTASYENMPGAALREMYHDWDEGEEGENPRPAALVDAMKKHLRFYGEPLLTVGSVNTEATFYGLSDSGKILSKPIPLREPGKPIEGGFPVVVASGNRLVFTPPAKPAPNGLILTNG